MVARSIWQGTLEFKQHELPVKLYSAVVDQHVHFHLLHRRDRTRVEQRMVDPETETPVPAGETRKAFEAEPGLFVTITSQDIEKSLPKPSRSMTVTRFVSLSAIDPRHYDRPYYLGPSADFAADYSAFTQALDRKKRAGIVTWVMRKQSYVGALISRQGYLMLITLRHSEEVVPPGQLKAPANSSFGAKERHLAEKLIDALSARFEPQAYHDEYQQRIHDLIDAKRRGKKVMAKRAPRRRLAGSLTESLEASLKSIRTVRRS